MAQRAIGRLLPSRHWRPPDRIRLLNQFGDGQDQWFLKARSDDLQSHRQARTSLARGDAARGQAHEREQKGRRDPVDIILELSTVDLAWKVHLDRKRTDRRSGREQDIEAIEQRPESMEHL